MKVFWFGKTDCFYYVDRFWLSMVGLILFVLQNEVFAKTVYNLRPLNICSRVVLMWGCE